MKPLIDQAFWSDPDIERSKPGVKLAALWLITNSQTNLIGICGASDARFKFETGLESEALQRALEALHKSFVRVGDVVFVRNYIRHQFGVGEKLVRNNFFTALCSLFSAVKDPELRKALVLEYPEFESAPERASKGLAKPKDVKKGEGKERKGGVKRGNPLQDPAFDQFWDAYPYKQAKENAEVAWVNKGCAVLLPQILTSIRSLKSSSDWTKNGGEYIPLPATWLNRRGWEDEARNLSNGKNTAHNLPLPPMMERFQGQ